MAYIPPTKIKGLTHNQVLSARTYAQRGGSKLEPPRPHGFYGVRKSAEWPKVDGGFSTAGVLVVRGSGEDVEVLIGERLFRDERTGKYKDSKYDYLGGGRNKDEGSFDAAVREFDEETGGDRSNEDFPSPLSHPAVEDVKGRIKEDSICVMCLCRHAIYLLRLEHLKLPTQKELSQDLPEKFKEWRTNEACMARYARFVDEEGKEVKEKWDYKEMERLHWVKWSDICQCYDARETDNYGKVTRDEVDEKGPRKVLFDGKFTNTTTSIIKEVVLSKELGSWWNEPPVPVASREGNETA